MAGDGPRRWPLTTAVGPLLLVLCLASLSATGDEAATSGKEQALRQLQKEITTLQHSLQDSKSQRQQLQALLQQAERRIGETTNQLRVLDRDLKQQQQKLAALTAERADRQRTLGDNRQALIRQLRSAYAMGRQERIKILLNQQDPAVISRMMVYYDYFNRARSRQINDINNLLEALQQSELALLAEERRLRETQARVQDEQQLLDQQQAQRQQVLALLNRDIQDKDKTLQAYRQDEQRLQELVKRLQSDLVFSLESDQQQPFKQLKGKLQWPTRGRLVSLFGQTRAANLKWDGVVIAASEGSEVRAVHHGRVAFADWLRGFGLLLIIDHGDGYMSLYGRNQSLFKETGEWVEAGEPVALVGNSGGQSKPGVYFGIRYKGRPQNPKKWCEGIRDNRIGTLSRERLPDHVGWGTGAVT